MAGIEALQPSMSSDPQARLWSQVHALQRRITALESRRHLVFRLAQRGSVTSASASDGFNWWDEGTFPTAGRPVLITLGPVTASFGRGPLSTTARLRINGTTLLLSDLVRQDTSTTPSIVPGNGDAGVFELPAGEHIWRLTTGTTPLQTDYVFQILELPS